MLDPSKRFLTLVLVLGTAVLLLAIVIGESMGDKVLGSATERRLGGLPSMVITPAPTPTTGPYGPDWKRSQSLASAPDPGFPDPRVPPQPLPTPIPRPTVAPPKPTPTYNPGLPPWRQKPLPTVTPGASPAPTGPATPAPIEETPVPGPSVPPQNP